MNSKINWNFLKQIIITSRPAGWAIFWVSYLGGYLVSQRALTLFDLVYTVLIVPILSFALYSINDVYDYESDKVNKRKNLLIMGGVLQKKYWLSFKILCFISCFIVLATPLVFGNTIALFFSIFGLLIGIGYSLPPIRFKTVPGGDIAANTLGFVCLFGIGSSVNFSLELLLFALPYVSYSSLMVMSWSCLCLSLDQEADKNANHKTTSVRLGRSQSYAITILGYLICGFITLFWFKNSMPALLFLSAFLTFVGYFFKSFKWNVTLMILITALNVAAYSAIYFPFVQKML